MPGCAKIDTPCDACTYAGSPGGADLGPAESSELVAQLRGLPSVPTITLMVAYPAGSEVEQVAFDAAAVQGSDAIKWITHDSSKPGMVGLVAALA